MRCIYLVLAVWCIIHQSYSSLVTIERNGYRGIVVAFSHGLETADKELLLLQGLKDIFREASKVLYEITNQHAYFGEIIFIIPKSWGEEDNWLPADDIVEEIGLVRYNEADIFVEAGSGLFEVPYTIQASGCEQQGLGIHLPLTFIHTLGGRHSVQEIARNLVYEWLKYRFGIFDEHGFQDDNHYPVLHGIPGNSEYMKVTSCSNRPVKYEINPQDEERCKINKNTGRLDRNCPADIILERTDQSSSFMFSPKMSKLCGSDGYHHVVGSPTKHNALCFETSISEILFRHKDLKEQSFSPGNTTFRYVQESELRLVLAIDRSEDTSGFDLHLLLTKIINMFLDLSLPEDHSIDLLFYDSQDATVVKHYEENWSFPNSEDTGPGCVRCALRDSLKVLEKYEPMDGSILVLIARHSFSDDEIETLRNIATGKNIRVHVIFCLIGESSISQMAKKVAGTGIMIQNIPVENKDFVYLLYSALQSSVRGNTFGTANNNIVIMQESFLRTTSYINFTFPVDKTAKRDIKILLSSPKLMVIYEGHSGVSTNDANMENGKDYKFIEKARSGVNILEILNETVGDIKVSIKKKGTEAVEVLVLAKATSNSSAIVVRSWLNHIDQFITVDDDSKPVILYTEVRSGNFPVRNANVNAYLHHPDSTITTFALIDDGIGDPDITKGDGIYSSYITGYSTEGDYVLNVIAVDDGRAEIVLRTKTGSTCCGSFVPATETVPTGRFRRLYMYGNIYVSLPEENNDFYPPSRITDLKVTNIALETSGQLYITFSFSAPGGNYNHDKASKYELSYSKLRHTVRHPESSTIADNYHAVMPSPAKYGHKEVFRFEFPATKLKELQKENITVVFFSVWAVDSGNKTGKPSNIVEVQLPVPPPPPTVDPSVNSTPNPINNKDNEASGTTDAASGNGKMNSAKIGMIAGIVVGVIVLIIAVITALFLFSKRKRTIKDNRASPENIKTSKEYLSDSDSRIPTPLSNPISPIQSWPANVLLDHYDKVQETKREKESSNNSIASSSSDSSRPLKPNPIYATNEDRYSGNNRYSPPAPYSSSQTSLNQAPRSVTQV